ncbi:radial spoke head 10 homolog B isoform X13 [Chrysemys picta bellii]|uniref:radial spoke head 10 homolog B isoform X13 n=1 Tax=Chrysemys picta bellii TaxID=8478 RepID=UPI0032B1A183
MAKDKKKDGKKTEKLAPAPPLPPETSLEGISSVQLSCVQTSLNQAEEAQASPLESQEESKEMEEPLIQEAAQYYEEPILTQLIVENYEGEKVHGLYDGEGVAYFQGGNIYRGMFSEGLMHGHGIYTWADGVKYEGNFVKNVQMYNGSYTWPDGSMYEGEVKNGVRHGFGMYKCGTHPVSYIGQWCEGKRHGKGTIYYNREGTSWYEGDWVNNIKDGWGIRCYKSGNIYEGQWEKNVRHGEGRMRWLTTNQEYTGQWINGIQGRFVFKNGRIYEGEFINDQIAEYPAFQVDAMNMQDLSGIRTQSPFGTETIRIVDGPGNTSVLGSNIELDISSLLNLFPEKDRQEEMKQVEYAVLRHITELRRIYSFYSSLGCDQSLDNTFLMTKLQFWRFLKDCRFHHYNVTLADMDRILNEDKTTPEEVHSPYETLLLRTFLTCLIHLAVHINHKEHKDKGPYLFKCFSKMMMKNIIPNACHIQGILFCEQQQTVCAINYIDKCWEIYRAYCRPSTIPPYEPTMKMRHFLWMLKDLNMLSKQLTATKIVEILVKDNPFVRDGDDSNLQHELKSKDSAVEYRTSRQTFKSTEKEREAIVEHASTIGFRAPKEGAGTVPNVTFSSNTVYQLSADDKDEMLVQSLMDLDAEQGQVLSNPMKEFADKLEKAKNEQKEKLSLWLNQMYIFFVNKFFPAYKHAQMVKENVEENRKRDAELALQLKIEEEAKLIAIRKAEEAKKQEEAAAEKAETDSGVVKEPEDSATQLPLPAKEEVVILPQPVISKVSAGVKKKKK